MQHESEVHDRGDRQDEAQEGSRIEDVAVACRDEREAAE